MFNRITLELSASGNVKESVQIYPNTDLEKLLINLKNKGFKDIPSNPDPDDSIISKMIYKVVFPFYDDNTCRGDTMNTYNSSFGKNNNYRLLEIMENENLTLKKREEILKKAAYFKNIYLTIGNFTVLEKYYNDGNRRYDHINNARGSYCSVIRDSWPLTLLCIKDYLTDYKLLNKNPLKNVFINNPNTISFFSSYKNINNGFNAFCDDHFLSPKYYQNKNLAYVDDKYEVKLDLFNGLDFSKPLPETVLEIEQYIERTSEKIIARGNIILKAYSEKAKGGIIA